MKKEGSSCQIMQVPKSFDSGPCEGNHHWCKLARRTSSFLTIWHYVCILCTRKHINKCHTISCYWFCYASAARSVRLNISISVHKCGQRHTHTRTLTTDPQLRSIQPSVKHKLGSEEWKVSRNVSSPGGGEPSEITSHSILPVNRLDHISNNQYRWEASLSKPAYVIHNMRTFDPQTVIDWIKHRTFHKHIILTL